MLCSRVNGRSRLNDSMTDGKPTGCLATMKLTKRLKSLKEKNNNRRKVTPETPAGVTKATKDVFTPNNLCEDKENVGSTGMTCRTASRLNGLGVRGQLKVSLEVDNGILTVNVVEGKQLKFKPGSSGKSYVQVSVVPSDDSMLRYTTKMAYNTTNPHYDETFKHELEAGDERKRVLIAVWSECGINSVLVGCMSFGVKHLVYKWKSVAGWFYLLSEDLGTKKHLKMFSSRQSLKNDTNNNTKQQKTNSMTLLVTPNPSQYGYGFLVSGSCPSEVSRVLPGSAAEAAGLQPGDVIVKIDTQNVARSASGSINKIIEEANETLVMEVRRAEQLAAQGSSSSRPVSAASSRSRLAPCSSISTLNSWSAPFDDNNNKYSHHYSHPAEPVYNCRRPKRASSKLSLNSEGSGRSSTSHHSYQSIRSLARGAKDVNSLKRVASQGLEPISEELSPSPRRPLCDNKLNESEFAYQWKQSRKSCDGESDHGLQYVEQDCWDIVAHLDRAVIPSCGKKTTINQSMIPNASVSTNAADDTELPTYEQHTMSTFRDDSCSQWENFQTTTCTTSLQASPCGTTTFMSCTTEAQHMVSLDSAYNTTSNTSSSNPLHASSVFVDPSLVEVADRLLACEEEFATKMHFGAERFSRPLRHCVLLPQDHKTLFQNVEKLVAISEFHVKKLNELKYEGGAGVSSAYLSQLALMCDAYTAYCQGLARALSLLDDLSHNKEFMRFVQEPDVPEEELNITEFLEKPLLHLEELVYHLNQLVEEMPGGDSDFANMRHVLSALKGCYSNLQAEYTLLRGSYDDDLDSEEEEEEDDVDDDVILGGSECHFRSGASSAASSSSGPMFSIDSEVADLQQRLSFPADMAPFQVVGPNRHLIYQGELLFVDSWKWVRVQVTLLSDQLLLTMEGEGDRLVPIMPPVLLKDITNWDFDSYHPSEFMLMLDNHDSLLEDDADLSETRLQSLVFRALENDQKSTWRHLLAQRVKACRSQREYCL